MQLDYLDLAEEQQGDPFEDDLRQRKSLIDVFDYELARNSIIRLLDYGDPAKVTVPMTVKDALIHARIQLPVGQGGFHMAGLHRFDRLRGDHEIDPYKFETLWVYDCGSIPRRHVDACIADFLVQRTSKLIDFLFLSHLDLDHMCGVTTLLDKKVRGKLAGTGATARTIILPYLDDTERTIALSRAVSLHGADSINGFIGEAILDPVQAFLRRGAERVVLVGSDEDESDPPAGFIPIDPPSFDGGAEDGMGWKIVRQGDGVPLRCSQSSDGRAILVRGGSFEIGARAHKAYWHLVPYILRADPTRVGIFKMAAEVQLGWKQGEFDSRMAARELRQEVVAKDRMKLARAYEYAFGDKNLTSLSLYSGPSEPERTWACRIAPCCFETEPARISWLATGDAHLEDHAAIDALELHYGARLDYVGTYVVPHHGSIANSNPDRLPTHANDWVVCADPSHEWDHPAEEIVDAIRRRGKFRHVRADPSTEFREVAVLGWR